MNMTEKEKKCEEGKNVAYTIRQDLYEVKRWK